MVSFLKSFFAALLAILVFTVICLAILIVRLSFLASSSQIETGKNAVIVLDLSEAFHEQMVENPLAILSSEDQYSRPGLYDVIRMIRYASHDNAIRGIYLKCNANANGFASSEEIRNALLAFRKSGKFIVAFGDIIPQKAYYVANAASRIYCNPKGGVDWRGFAAIFTFFKSALQKLEIEPQIFYAGKFKSATEPFREEKMTDANRLQTTELLEDLFNRLLNETGRARGLDTAVLRHCAEAHLVQSAHDALQYGLVDGLAYDDQVGTEIRNRMDMDSLESINFIPIEKYAHSVSYKRSGKERIALIYAEGEIIGGKNDQQEIGGDIYRSYIRNARMDKNIKAIVLRINSGGGSSLISENLWRELAVARKMKPVIISFGDVAASGAYYMSCQADSIFAQPNTITGSIGVFSIIPNMQSFFKNKLGITFDGVRTAPDADEYSGTKPLTELQKKYFQNQVDSIYLDFRTRVADGRKKTVAYVDSIGQGRVWTADRGLELGLVDRMGGLEDAIDCAARMAGISDYHLVEYPGERNFLELLFGNYKKNLASSAVKDDLGTDGYRLFIQYRRIRQMLGSTQSRMPFEFSVQ
jgi:protease-4